MSSFPKPPRWFETERLRLVARAVDHAEEVFAMIDQSRSHLRPWMPWEEQSKTVHDSEEYLKLAITWWEIGKTFDYSVFEKVSGKMVGSYGFHTLDWETRSAHVGYWLGASHQGKGYVSECLKASEQHAIDMGIHRLVLTCDAANQRSINAAIRNGYQREAYQVDGGRTYGRIRDTLCFVKLLNPPKPGEVTENLPLGFSIKAATSVEFWDLVERPMQSIFDENDLIVRPDQVISQAEADKLKSLNTEFRRFYTQFFLLMKDGDLAGWSWGYQDSRDSFYMVNSAVLPEHRGRGLYKRLLDVALETALAAGFQKIWSRHTSTNSAILIPKLKKGFVITGTELSDTFGSLVHLSYLSNPIRRQILDFRAGALRPDPKLKSILGL